ncbi:hypothetical protein ACXO2A_08910, partial [Lactobacillus delbrueckii subsp. bulgaricus]|nr:hypothetical protein [Lactobacillus delbrueckii subsp. bulgaricus]
LEKTTNRGADPELIRHPRANSDFFFLVRSPNGQQGQPLQRSIVYNIVKIDQEKTALKAENDRLSAENDKLGQLTDKVLKDAQRAKEDAQKAKADLWSRITRVIKSGIVAN